MTRIYTCFSVTMLLVFSGCALASKDVRLLPPQTTQPESDRLKGVDFSISVAGAPLDGKGVIGSTGWSLANVRTSQSVYDWFAGALSAELEKVGAKKAEQARTLVKCVITSLDASLGIFSLIKSKITVSVALRRGENENDLGAFTAECSPFVLFDTTAAYEEAISETLKNWMESYAPRIIDELATAETAPAAKPAEPVKPSEPTVEPEVRPEATRIAPDLTITSPEQNARVNSSAIVIAGNVENAAGGELSVSVNGAEAKSIHIVTAHEPFSIPVELIAGKNEISVTAMPAEGKLSEVVQKTVFYTPPQMTGIRVISLGVPNFKSLEESPKADVIAAAVHNRIAAGVAPPDSNALRLIEPKVAHRDLLAGFKTALEAGGKDNYVILFYCGVVKAAGGDLMFAVCETDPENPGTALLFSDIVLAVERNFKGKRVVLIAQNAPDQPALSMPELEFPAETLAAVIFTPDKDSRSAISEGLEGAADSDRNGYVSLSELKSYLESRGTLNFLGNADPSLYLSRIDLSKR